MHVYIHMHAYIHTHVYIYTHAPYACIGGFVLRGVEILDLYACTICTPYACIGGLVYVGGSRLELKLKIDDPLDAFAVRDHVESTYT